MGFPRGQPIVFAKLSVLKGCLVCYLSSCDLNMMHIENLSTIFLALGTKFTWFDGTLVLPFSCSLSLGITGLHGLNC